MQKIKQAQRAWDEEKKKELVTLGESKQTYGQILAYLENEIAISKKMSSFNYALSCFRDDGVYQLHRSIEHFIGASTAINDKKPSDGGDKPINTIDIVLANGLRKKIPYGKIALPDMGKDAMIEIYYDEEERLLYVRGTCQFKFQHLIDNIIDRAKHLLNTDSIYKNQAIEISADVNYGQPQVLDLSNIDQEPMILSSSTKYALSPLYARIQHPEKCISKNIPLKFGCLLEGPYGTGKTLLAFKLAQLGIENNWSFIYLKSPELLADTLKMAKNLDKNGNGIIIFTEDVDQVTRGDRDASLQEILNTLDGGDTKQMNVISLFTTNHIELIEPTFLRGKRIGTIISLGYLDKDTAREYIEFFCEGIELTEDFEKVYDLIEKSEIAPAFMAEIIENVKSIMLLRDESSISATNFIVCIESYLRQVALSQTKDTTKTKEIVFSESLKQIVAESLKNIMKDEEYTQLLYDAVR